MNKFIVSIEDRADPGSPYYLVATDDPAQLEEVARKTGFVAVVRRTDGYLDAVRFMHENRPAG